MDTMQEHGPNLARVIRCLDDKDVHDLEQEIRFFLLDQPESWEGLMDLEDIIAQIYAGITKVILLGKVSEWKGMVLYTVHQYSPTTRVMKVDFLSCKNFYFVMQLYDYLEEIAKTWGAGMIEAVAHPTIADYLYRKQDFVAYGVYIRKELRASRRN